ncbi:MAG: DUF262 domain-containing protein [Alloprevotella sp.]|nr:MAG: DUF262 domain-containing protein [Alloprevotella sp.]
MNTIKMKSVGELVRAAGNSSVERYKISSYQRGYRWKAEEQVRALLDDLKDFFQQPKGEIYCLQPIVVAKGQDEKGEFWEVIDGQQRLTTLFLLLHVLGEKVYDIDFEVRVNSAHLLTDIVGGKAVDTDKSPDAYFMSEAYKKIKQWVDEQQLLSTAFKRKYATTLLDSVQVIWYEVALTSATTAEQEKEKIDIFNRLNIGKIPLDDAELLRALFLNHIVGEGTHDDVLLKGIFATEWQEMEYFLQKDDVWGFLNPEDKAMRNRILLLFRLVAQAKTSQGRATFCFFENELRELSHEERIAKVQDYWKETKRLFAFIRACYNDRHLYHILGLCFALKLCKLNELVELSKMEKTKFRSVIKTKIKEKFKNVKLEILNYNDNAADIKNVLLLFNVLTMDQQDSLSQQRFPFHKYHQNLWSLEHIHAQKSEAVQGNIAEQLANMHKELEELNKAEIPELQSHIKEILSELTTLQKKKSLNEEDIHTFNLLMLNFEALFSDDASSEMHEMSNMALLTSGDNAALNNSYFLSKRIKLLQLERNGAFIPPCTRNVFLKVYSPIGAPSYKWGQADREAYLKAMKEVVKEFIPEN